VASHGGELRRRSWAVAHGGSGRGHQRFELKGKRTAARAASVKKWRRGPARAVPQRERRQAPARAAPRTERMGAGPTGVRRWSASTSKWRARASTRRGGMERPGQASPVADVWAPWPECQHFELIQRGSTVSNDFKSIQNCSILIQPKTDLHKLHKFKIKCGFEVMTHNTSHTQFKHMKCSES
jgi:hypothetical protein